MTNGQARVLNVGQCGFDHANITRMLQTHFAAQVDQADTLAQAERCLTSTTYDLVLVNRILDADGTDGVELVRRVGSLGSAVPRPPIMLVSNLPDAQAAAVAEGAVPGFGKAELAEAATIARLEAFLA